MNLMLSEEIHILSNALLPFYFIFQETLNSVYRKSELPPTATSRKILKYHGNGDATIIVFLFKEYSFSYLYAKTVDSKHV